MPRHGPHCTCGTCIAKRISDSQERATYGGQTRDEMRRAQGMGSASSGGPTRVGGECADCGGTGDCIHCNQGMYPRRDGTNAVCGKCHGRTKCHACRGKGYGGRRCNTPTWQEMKDRVERQREEDRRMREYRESLSRPEGVQEAGNTWVDGDPGYYEDGGSTGKKRRRERYSGPNGPLGPGHHHDSSEDGGETWKRWH